MIIHAVMILYSMQVDGVLLEILAGITEMIDVSSYRTNGRKNMQWESRSHVMCQVIQTNICIPVYSLLRID